MNSGTLGFVAGCAGFFLGAVGVFLATDAQRTAQDAFDAVAHDDDAAGMAFERITALEEALRSQNEQVRGVRADEDQLRARVRELLLRLEALETWSHEVDTSGGSAAPPISVDLGTAKRERFDALREKIWDGTATPQEEADFWELARTTGVLDDLVKELAGRVDEAPRDIERRMQLASAYTSKLLTVPDGPERGAWAMRAEGQWGAILEIDESHWQARFNRAFSWSQWPPFMSKAPAAIDEFETLRTQQESSAPEPHHARVYQSLAELYRGQGNVERATEILRAGVDRHPDSEALRKALDTATR